MQEILKNLEWLGSTKNYSLTFYYKDIDSLLKIKLKYNRKYSLQSFIKPTADQIRSLLIKFRGALNYRIVPGSPGLWQSRFMSKCGLGFLSIQGNKYT